MWHFREAAYEDTIAESKLGEFFSGSPSQAIIRESFQNSLDAIEDPKKPVRIVVSLGNANAEEFPEAYEALSVHWQAAGRKPSEYGSGRFLLIEDFNTKVLLGPIDKEQEPHDSLYSFWWEEGRSNKRKGSGGSHGVGKSTLSGASDSNAFLALTRRADGEELLIGYSILPPHRYGQQEYLGYARFGKRVKRQSDNANVIYPFVDPDDTDSLSRFRKHAQLRRNLENGLSVFIPDVRREITENELMHAIIENFFFPIIKENLVVEINDLGTGTSQVIQKANILSLVDSNGYADDLRATIEVSLEATRLASKDEFFYPRPDFEFTNDAGLTSDSFSDANLKKMQDAYAAGEVVSARLAIPILLANSKKVVGYADLFAKGSGSEIKPIYKAFRGNILIEKEKCRATQPYDVLILDIFNDDDGNELSEYMKYAEDPGHTEWKNSTLRRTLGTYAPSEYWQRHAVQRFGSSFIAVLSGTENQEQLVGFADDIFFVEKEVVPETPGAKSGGRGIKLGTDSPLPPEIPPPAPQLFRIQRLANGRATVTGTDHLGEYLEKSGCVHGKVWAANIIFGSSKSNWRKRHNPSDFDFRDDGMVEGNGVTVKIVAPNSLEFIAEQQDFSIELVGFDPNRDVYIDVRKVAETGQ